jgi:peptidoglycan-N-acetylglucosamine deacetylase
MASSGNSPVFYDPGGRRWRRVRRTWMALAVLVTCLAGVFIASVLINPALPSLNIRPVASLPHSADLKPQPPNPPANPAEKRLKRAEAVLQHALRNAKRVVPSRRPAETIAAPAPVLPPPAVPSTRPLSIGFYINWDESSLASLERNIDHLDWVITEWSHLEDHADGNPLSTDIHTPALNFIRQTHPQVRIIPMVQNLTDEKWDSQIIARNVADEPSRRHPHPDNSFVV